MKKKFILLPIIGLFLYLGLSSYSTGPGSGSINGTGSSGSTTGCGGGGCHGSSLTSSTTVTVQLLSGTTPVTSYVPGAAYTLKITGTNTSGSSLPRYGFQMSVVKLAGAGTGSASSVGAGTYGTTPSGTHIATIGSVTVFEHFGGSIAATTGTGGSGTTYVQSIPWTAPAAGTGSVVVYGIVNAVNANGGADGGDLWNTAAPVTICEQASPITGTLSVCAGATTTLSDLTTGGTWSSLSGNATIGATTGVVTGVTAGNATINYTTSCGTVSAIVTVNPAPSVITGLGVVCPGQTTSLFDGTPSGTWTSLSPSIATIGSSSGVVTGVATSGGTATINYTLPVTGCTASKIVTVNPAPTAISGTTALCEGATTNLTNGVTGGTWTSSNTAVATIGSTSGVVNALVTGSGIAATTTITYTTAGGCVTSTVLTVNPMPSPISGPGVVCPGATITLTDAGGGVWTSGSTSVATIGSSSGIVTGISALGGTSVITYGFAGTGCSVTKTVTVNPAPTSISGTPELCPGTTTTLSSGGTGTWLSSSPGIATVGATTGIVTGVSTGGGTSTITYTLTSTGCFTTTTVTVDAAPAAITGTLSLCQGTNTTLIDATCCGTWSSATVTVGSIDPSTGVLNALSPGTAAITFTLLGTGCTATSVVTVNPLPAVATITGTPTVCVGATTALNDVTPSGTWSSSNTATATVGSTGIVTGIAAGSANISYTVTNGSGCTTASVMTVTVNPNPAAITGPTRVCIGSSIALTESASGNWVSGTTAVATLTTPGSTSTLLGVSSGTTIVTYTVPTTGCKAFTTITVNPQPGSITGTPTVCVGLTTALDCLPTGGSWTSSNTNASVGSGSGIVTGVVSGTSTITYTLPTGCFTTRLVTVNALPGSITGPTQVCAGSTITLTAAGGGSWSSSNANATVVAGTGVVTGVTAGTSVITYTLGTGCYRTVTITINPLPTITVGATNVCVGQTITFTAGGGGNWTSSNAGIASVGSATGIITGNAPGTADISYTLTGTGCRVTQTVTVNPLFAIGGLTSLCSGSTTTLTNATSGGTWTSSNTAVATIGSGSGLVTAIGPGSSVITYTTPAGCVTTSTMNVISAPSAIAGPSTLCVGTTITLTDAGGGIWTSSTPSAATVGSASGIVTGVGVGTTTITYSLGTGCTVTKSLTVNPAAPAITGTASVCEGSVTTLADAGLGGWVASNSNVTVGSTGVVTGITAGTSVITFTTGSGCYATRTVTVNPLPAAISGTLQTCVGTTTTLTDATSGGTWTSSAPSIANITSTTGIVGGLSAGTANITYTITLTGCRVSAPFTVNPNPSAIAGTATVCPGATTALTDGGGGTWTSSNANASVDPTGLVTGVTSGTSTITYTLSTGCFVTRTVTVTALPGAISGSLTLCAGATSALSVPTTPGGTWSSVTTSVATIGVSSGLVSGVSGGTSVISYTLPSTGCSRTATVTVNAAPAAISGTTNACVGATSTLVDAGGGTWSATPGTIATIGSGTGIVTGVGAGIATVTYTLPSGCFKLTSFTVNALPAAIGGTATVCTGATTTLTDVGGGTWTSSTPATATIGSASGIVSGITTGTTDITYTLATGCARSITVTVNASPSPVTGTAAICAGSATTLSDATTGGTWSSSAPSVATAGSTGIVNGVAAGTATISYTIGTGCSATMVVTVNPLPAAISGTPFVCPGADVTLTDAGAGTWTSSATTIATIGSSSGLMTGVAAGTATITYTLPTGCLTTLAITVNPLPVAGTISGAGSVCADSSITLTDAAPGGVWSSTNTALATVGSTGIVTGVTAGTDSIVYAVTNSCGTVFASVVITVNPLPVAGTVTSPSHICMGSSITLTDGAPGGTWSSSNTALATIGAATGVVTTVAPGVLTFTYSVTNGCGTATATATDTIIATPVAGTITGADSVCAGDTLHLANTATGGTWSVTNGNATVDASGVVTAITAGTDSVIYTVTNTCGTVQTSKLLNIRSYAACHVGVQAAPSLAGFNVYPNPSAGTFTVSIPESANGSDITIVDMMGKVVETRNIQATSAQNITIHLSNVAAGSYLIRVNAANTTYREKIVIW